MKFKYEDIETYCNDMHHIATNMKDIMDKIESEYLNLQVSGCWSGPASSFYKDKFKKLISNFDEAHDEIEMAVLFLAKVSDGYKAIDENVVREICNNLKITEPNLTTSKVFQ